MRELHWTGAAVLLALAVLGSGGAGRRRAEIPSWTDFAREHGLAAEPQLEFNDPLRRAAERARSARPHGAETRRAS
jgi:hypothetical protein